MRSYFVVPMSFIFIFIFAVLAVRTTRGQTRTKQEKPRFPLHKSLVSLNCSRGQQLLIESKTRSSYIPLSIYFTTQKDLGSCGVASGTMVLNALPIPKPVAKQYSPYRMFTQTSFLNEKTNKITTPKRVSTSGMTLLTLAKVLRTYPVTVEVAYASESNLNEFRKKAIKALNGQKKFVIVNYLRKAINQERGGHFSPLAAYHKKSDRFLILDVARYKYPPVWVKTADLWRAMATKDSESKRTRGYLIVGAPSR